MGLRRSAPLEDGRSEADSNAELPATTAISPSASATTASAPAHDVADYGPTYDDSDAEENDPMMSTTPGASFRVAGPSSTSRISTPHRRTHVANFSLTGGPSNGAGAAPNSGANPNNNNSTGGFFAAVVNGASGCKSPSPRMVLIGLFLAAFLASLTRVSRSPAAIADGSETTTTLSAASTSTSTSVTPAGDDEPPSPPEGQGGEWRGWGGNRWGSPPSGSQTTTTTTGNSPPPMSLYRVCLANSTVCGGKECAFTSHMRRLSFTAQRRIRRLKESCPRGIDIIGDSMARQFFIRLVSMVRNPFTIAAQRAYMRKATWPRTFERAFHTNAAYSAWTFTTLHHHGGSRTEYADALDVGGSTLNGTNDDGKGNNVAAPPDPTTPTTAAADAPPTSSSTGSSASSSSNHPWQIRFIWNEHDDCRGRRTVESECSVCVMGYHFLYTARSFSCDALVERIQDGSSATIVVPPELDARHELSALNDLLVQRRDCLRQRFGRHSSLIELHAPGAERCDGMHFTCQAGAMLDRSAFDVATRVTEEETAREVAAWRAAREGGAAELLIPDLDNCVHRVSHPQDLPRCRCVDTVNMDAVGVFLTRFGIPQREVFLHTFGKRDRGAESS